MKVSTVSLVEFSPMLVWLVRGSAIAMARLLPSKVSQCQATDKCSFKSTMKKHLTRNARVIHESADIA